MTPEPLFSVKITLIETIKDWHTTLKIYRSPSCLATLKNIQKSTQKSEREQTFYLQEWNLGKNDSLKVNADIWPYIIYMY